LDRPDVPAFPQAVVVHLDLCLHPFLDAADIHPDAESLLDADRGVVRQVCFGRAGAVLEAHRRRDLKAVGVGILADRELPRPADAALDHLALASNQERPA